MMLESIHFSFNGIHSVDMGVLHAHIDNSLIKENFIPKRSIEEQKIFGRDNPYFKRISNEANSFPMTIFFDGKKKDKDLREIARWLFQDYYKPLIFSSNPNKIYYVLFDEASTFNHDGSGNGYIEVNARCNSPYSYSPIKITDSIKIENESEKVKFYDFFEQNHIILNNVSMEKGELKVKNKSKYVKEIFNQSKVSDILG